MLQEVIPTSLLKLNSENTSRAVKMFLGVQKFMGEGSDALPTAQRFDLAQKLLHQVCIIVLLESVSLPAAT